MDNVFQNFLIYCQTQRINLLKDDKIFIERLIKGIPMNYKRRLLRQYLVEWKQGVTENEGRRRANTFLREFMGGL